MNPVQPDKLVQSQWTAVAPTNNERHFVVAALQRDANGKPCHVVLKAILTGQTYERPWRDLQDDSRWQTGWRR